MFEKNVSIACGAGRRDIFRLSKLRTHFWSNPSTLTSLLCSDRCCPLIDGTRTFCCSAHVLVAKYDKFVCVHQFIQFEAKLFSPSHFIFGSLKNARVAFDVDARTRIHVSLPIGQPDSIVVILKFVRVAISMTASGILLLLQKKKSLAAIHLSPLRDESLGS